MNRIIKVFLILAVIINLMITSLQINAHTTSQKGKLKEEYIHYNYNGYYIGGESVGWSIDENMHIGSNKIQYRFSTIEHCLNSGQRDVFRQGAMLWRPCGEVTETTSYAGTVGVIKAINNPTSAAAATFITKEDGSSVDSKGHLIKDWSIEINSAKTFTPSMAAHEIGHAFGLNDLYESKNSKKLMYFQANDSGKGPTGYDVCGFNVITGKHTNHNFNSNGVCSGCNGLKP